MERKALERKIEEIYNGVVITTYDSITKAAKSLNIERQSLHHVLSGRCKQYRGKQYRYVIDTLEGEEWLDHPIGIKVSNFGRAEYPTGKRTYGSTTFHGYKHVHFKHKNYRLHRLILEAFVGPCPIGLECDHIDRNRSNNHINNLRWVTKVVNQSNRKEYKNSRKLTIKSDAE